MRDKPTAIVLGGTIPHAELIRNLNSRGYYTVLIDYYDTPPAKTVAHKHLRESTLDKLRVLEIAKNLHANLVISTCIDQAGVTACYVAEQLGLPAPYSYETALNCSNKVPMKRIMSRNQIPTSQFCVVEKSDEVSEANLKLPIVVKPADSNSSKGVRKADNQQELKAYLKSALEISRNKKAIVEEFVEGEEIGLDCFIEGDKAHIIMMHRKRKPVDKSGSVIYSIGSVSPPDITETAKKNIGQLVKKIAKAFGLNNTPLLLQTIVNGDNVSVVEFAPRIGGGLNYRTIKLFTGFDIINAAIDSYLGVQVKPEYTNPGFFHSENHIYTLPGIFGYITGYQDLIDKRVIEEIYLNKSKGMDILPDMASRDRVASFFVKADNLEELARKIRLAMDTIQVYDIDGRNIMKKELYDNLFI